ncbi:hypothetical protein HPP92_012681 [Vanilla planifolia]|uniref:Major facilitator superfamily (MFS) profile domain-containing protein n=1 Tax=Vanilla planifolia TaxID=51239 RepID=A0A835UXA3_VANPL|nr:hypothetical protein HPP92_012681 [Vanilla planifolia]
MESSISIEPNGSEVPLINKDGTERSIWMVLISTAVAICGSFEFGSCVAFTGPTQSGIMKEMEVSLAQAMRMSALFCIVGWLAIYFAEDVLLLYFGRLSTGVGIGVFSYVVPVFIAEIAPKNLRGGLTALNQAKVGNQELFVDALHRLRGRDADISDEAAEIHDYIDTLDSLPKPRFVDLFQRKYSLSLIVGVGLMAFQQFGGINGIVFYSTQMFISAGFSSGDLGNILLGCSQVPIVAIGAILADNCGRKPLLLVSSSGTFLGCLLAAIALFLEGQGQKAGWTSILTLCGILVYCGSFGIGMGAIPWIIMSEIFPINVKGMAGSLVTLMNWFGAWTLSFSFNFLMSWSSWGTFAIFTVVCAKCDLCYLSGARNQGAHFRRDPSIHEFLFIKALPDSKRIKQLLARVSQSFIVEDLNFKTL